MKWCHLITIYPEGDSSHWLLTLYNRGKSVVSLTFSQLDWNEVELVLIRHNVWNIKATRHSADLELWLSENQDQSVNTQRCIATGTQFCLITAMLRTRRKSKSWRTNVMIPVRCTHHLISDCKTYSLDQTKSSNQRRIGVTCSATARHFGDGRHWRSNWMSQELTGPAGKTCLQMRISVSERSLESVQNESCSLCQVVVVGHFSAKMHGCSKHLNKTWFHNLGRPVINTLTHLCFFNCKC